MTTPVARGVAYGQQLTNHMEEFLGDNFTPYPYDQEDGRVRNFSSNVEVTLDPTAKRGRRLVELRIDGEPVDPEETRWRRSADPVIPNATSETAGSRSGTSRSTTIRYLSTSSSSISRNSPVDYEVMGLVETAEDGGRVQNTPADGPYPFIQPGVDYAAGEAYCETSMIPRRNTFPDAGRNRTR